MLGLEEQVYGDPPRLCADRNCYDLFGSRVTSITPITESKSARNAARQRAQAGKGMYRAGREGPLFDVWMRSWVLWATVRLFLLML